MKSYFIFLFVFFTMSVFSQGYYEYADGNNNVYTISETSIKYTPIKKQESSSGVYSGRDPKEKEISNEVYKKLEKLFESAFSAKKEQRTDRVMQSSLLIHYVSKIMSRKIILKPNSACKSKIESELNAILK